MMHYRHLITDDDYDVITSAPNDMKINCLILQYVKLMDVPMLLEFCNVLKSIETQQCIGKTLGKGKNFGLLIKTIKLLLKYMTVHVNVFYKLACMVAAK